MNANDLPDDLLMPKEDFLRRHAIAAELVPEISGWWLSHEPWCPLGKGQAHTCGYVACFSNRRHLVAVAPDGVREVERVH